MEAPVTTSFHREEIQLLKTYELSKRKKIAAQGADRTSVSSSIRSAAAQLAND